MDDKEIIALYFGRSEQAIRETAGKYGGLCANIAYNILGSREDAEESVNDTYFAVWNAIPPARPDSLRAFVCKIARNLALKRLEFNTAKKRMPDTGAVIPFAELEEMISDGSPPDVSDEELGRLIEIFLKTQSADARCVFIRRYWYFDKVSDIAKRYSFGESKVKSLLSRTRNRLKKFLITEGYDI